MEKTSQGLVMNYTTKQIFSFKRRYTAPFADTVAYLSLDKEKEVKWMATTYKTKSIFNVAREQALSAIPPGDGWSPPSWSWINYRDVYKLIVVVKKIVEPSDSYLEYQLLELFGEEEHSCKYRNRLEKPGTIKIESKKNIYYYSGRRWIRLVPSDWIGKRVEY